MRNKKVIERNNYTVLDAFRSFFFLIVVIGAFSLVMQIIITIVARSTGQSFSDVTSLEWVSLLSYILSPMIFIGFYFVYNRIRRISNTEALSDKQGVNLLPVSIAIVLAIICIFLFTPFINLIDYLFAKGGYSLDNTIPLQDKMSTSLPYFMLGLVIFAVLPAISEELIFRGLIQKSLMSKYSGFVTIIISTLLFVLVHGSLQQTVYQLLVGLMLGYLSVVGGSVVYSMILHFLNNAFVLVFSSFDIVGYLSADDTIYYNIFSMIFPFLIFLLGLVLVGILFWVLKYLRNRNFFRYETGKIEKFKDIDAKGVAVVQKSGFKGMWSGMQMEERIFMVACFVLVSLIWLINTASGFIG